MSKQAEEYKGRGLHNPKLKESFTNGKLKDLLAIVKKDEDLVLQIRNDYVNIYYCGGNIAKITSENSIQFDENYLSCEKEKRNGEKEKILQELKNPKSHSRDYRKYIDKLKDIMNKYWKSSKKRQEEKNMQHSLCVNNTEINDYTVIDLEFQISKISEYKYKTPVRPKGRYRNGDKKSPRFDIIAVRNSDKQLCVIELKCGTGALLGKSGLGDHADSFEGTIKRNHESFVEEIKNIIQDKKDLGLLNKSFSINDKAPEFMFAFVPKKDDKDRDGVVRNEKEQIQFMKDEIVRQKCSDYNVLFLKDDGNFRLE